MADVLRMLSDWADKVPNILNWILKKIYKEEKIKKRIIVDMTSNKSANRIQLLNNEGINFTLRIANFTPFDLTVEDITLEFFWGHITKKICKNNFTKVEKFSEKNIFLHENLSSEEAAKIVTTLKEKMGSPRLDYTIDFVNRLYHFQKYDVLSNFRIEILNKDVAIQKLRKPL